MTIAQHREIRRLAELRIKQKGKQVYDTFTPKERTVVQFGMLPGEKTRQAEAELLAEEAIHDGPYDSSDICRLLAVAIMDAANAGPDKMVV